MHSLFSEIFLPITLGIITLGMGLSLTEQDFRNIFTHPRAVTTGLISQMLLLPLIAFVIAVISDIDPLYKVGLMMIAACPGGATSNLVTYMLKGNVALSISMTAINSVITLITIPLVVTLSLEFFIHQDAFIRLRVGETMLNVFLITLLPAYVGTRIRKWKPLLADGLEKPLKIVLPLLLALIYTGVVLIDQDGESTTAADVKSILPYALALHLSAMAFGLLVARLVGLKWKDRYTIVVEVGLQNSALAIFVAATILKSQSMALVPVVYGAFTFFTTLLFGWLVKILSKKDISEKDR
ncbi:MAG: bile acid:sodium symporter family protein [Bacteroides sp.]|nr:bile acid:sodium symporter family protein [Bacteroides sp.]